MTQDALFLLAVAVVAIYTFRLSLRLAPPGGEFPVKTLIAAVLSAIVALAGVLPYAAGDLLRGVALVVGPVYALGPLLAVAVARLRRYRIAALLVKALYWTEEGRQGPLRLLTQVALQLGDVSEALELMPQDDTLMLAQAFALAEEWERVLELELPRKGDNSFLGEAARIEALLALGRREEAQLELEQMRTRWEASSKGPLGYRSLRLSEARLAAEQGDLGAVKELLGQPLPGVAAHRLLAVFARGARQAGRLEDAGRLYGQAYSVAPQGVRSRYARELEEIGLEPPAVARPRRAVATLALAGGLVLAYLAQLWLDANAGPFPTPAGGMRASSLASAFLLGLPPTLPGADAWWRFLSYTLVHGNLLHIAFNAWVLVDIGRVLEGRRGAENLLAAFVIGSAMGAYVTAIAHQGGPLILLGASGGVLGVAGALLADTMASRTAGDRMLRGSLVRWMLLIALISVAIPNVSLLGHLGGVIGGLLWGFLRQGLPAARGIDAFAGAAALAFLLVAAGHAAVLGYRLL